MGETEYSEALKLGKKEYRARIAKGQFPYLPVLDEILSEADIQTEQNMGLVHVPLDFVVGTSTMGRTYSFAANFMPILDWETEFAVKWSNLSDAQMNEGIRDPIKAFEYMNRYYVLEGNKRVSVLKYFNAVSIPAIVTRKIPKLSDDYDVRLYYEYMKFNEISRGQTAMFISHRLASTRFCDRIIHLENGGIIENGTHDELIAANGKYAMMYGLQSKYYSDSEGGL